MVDAPEELAPKEFRLLNERGVVVVRRCRAARSMTDRMVGLLGRAMLPPGEGLLLSPCSAIHTIGMQFPIDVVFLGVGGRVLKVARNVTPGQFRVSCQEAIETLEVASGWLSPELAAIGDRLVASPPVA